MKLLFCGIKLGKEWHKDTKTERTWWCCRNNLAKVQFIKTKYANHKILICIVSPALELAQTPQVTRGVRSTPLSSNAAETMVNPLDRGWYPLLFQRTCPGSMCLRSTRFPQVWAFTDASFPVSMWGKAGKKIVTQKVSHVWKLICFRHWFLSCKGVAAVWSSL